MNSDLQETPHEQVRMLPTDPRDMVPSAVRWARAILATVRAIPRAQPTSPRRSPPPLPDGSKATPVILFQKWKRYAHGD
jgi:hypothetical protein